MPLKNMAPTSYATKSWTHPPTPGGVCVTALAKSSNFQPPNVPQNLISDAPFAPLLGSLDDGIGGRVFLSYKISSHRLTKSMIMVVRSDQFL